MYQVQKIVASRINEKGKKEYQVKWVGYSNSENTWEPAKNLMSAKDILDQWNHKEDGKQENKKTIVKPQTKAQTVEKVQKVIQNIDDDESDKNEFAQSSGQLTGSISKQNSHTVPKINSAPKRKGKLTIDQPPKDVIKIIGVVQGDDKNLIFKVQINGKPKWVERNYLVPDHMLDLINFYEAAICFKN